MPLWPQLAVRRGRAAVAFYQEAFGAVVEHQVGGTDENPSIVAQLSFAGGTFWVSDESPEHRSFSPESLGGATTKLLLVVDDPAATMARAVAAGATEVAPVEAGHGWQVGRISDPFGHDWEVASPPADWPRARASDDGG